MSVNNGKFGYATPPPKFITNIRHCKKTSTNSSMRDGQLCLRKP